MEAWRAPMPLSVVMSGAARRPLRFGKANLPADAAGHARALVFEHFHGSRQGPGPSPLLPSSTST
jgi:hypothetical protein